jgi:hypothetical protein
MKLYSINTGYFKLDGGAMFGVVPKSMWQKLNVPDENNMCSWAMRCLLIEDGDRLIQVDNGMQNFLVITFYMEMIHLKSRWQKMVSAQMT